ncbi:MAG: phasin family protein [Acidisphaera sp.]|nr:phasin family protein [Acidisphaera sp.]
MAPFRKAASRQAQAASATLDSITESVATGSANTIAGMAAGTSTINEGVRAHMDKVTKTTEEFVSFGQGNMEAFLRAGQIWATGVQDLGKQVVATAQAQFDETVTAFKALAGVKSIKEAMDLQSSLTRSNLDKAVSEAGKMTDASLRIAEQAMAPLTARVTLAFEKFGRAV